MRPNIGDDGEFEQAVDPAYGVYEPSQPWQRLRRIPRRLWLLMGCLLFILLLILVASGILAQWFG